jgi:hypothetical protein
VHGAMASARDAGSERLSAAAACACGLGACGDRLWTPAATARGASGEHLRISASTSGLWRRALDAGRRRRG